MMDLADMLTQRHIHMFKATNEILLAETAGLRL